MSFYQSIPSVLLGATIASALVITLPQSASALTGEEINNIAREVTVMIVGEHGNTSSQGSGVIIARNGDTYYVLTNHHVVGDGQLQYGVVAPDRQVQRVDNIQVLAGDLDLEGV